MSDYPSRFHPARLRLPAAVAAVIAAAALALGPGLAPVVAVAEEPPAGEAAKAEAVKRIMAGREFVVYRKNAPAICAPLLEDFQAQRGIEYIEPIARAKRYHDPVFAPYRAMCPGLEFNKWVYPPQSSSTIDTLDHLPEEERGKIFEAVGNIYFGTRNFKLYRLDLDGDPANGEEYVFYAERYYLRNDVVSWLLHLEEIPREVDWNDILHPEDAPTDATFIDGGYTILDLANCKLEDWQPTHDPYDYWGGAPACEPHRDHQAPGPPLPVRSVRG